MHAQAPRYTQRVDRLILRGLVLNVVLCLGCGGPRVGTDSIYAQSRARGEQPAYTKQPVSTGKTEGQSQASKPTTDTLVQELWTLHNRERADEELPPLVLSPKLNKAAQVQAEGMVSMGEMTHEGADGSNVSARVSAQDYPYRAVAENVAYGQRSGESVMEDWMNSPGHRRNILGDFEEMGAAQSKDEDGRPYWCVVFGTPIPQLDPEVAARDLVHRFNRLRRNEGLPAFQSPTELQGYAQRLAKKAAGSASFEAIGNIFEGLREEGIAYRTARTLMFQGQPTPEAVEAAMTGRSDTRSSITGSFDTIGVGYETSEDGTPFWLLIFLKAR